MEKILDKCRNPKKARKRPYIIGFFALLLVGVMAFSGFYVTAPPIASALEKDSKSYSPATRPVFSMSPSFSNLSNATTAFFFSSRVVRCCRLKTNVVDMLPDVVSTRSRISWVRFKFLFFARFNADCIFVWISFCGKGGRQSFLPISVSKH